MVTKKLRPRRPRINIRMLLNKLSIETQFSKFTPTGKEPAVSHRLLAYTKHELELSKRSHTPFDIHLLKKNIQKKNSPPFHVQGAKYTLLYQLYQGRVIRITSSIAADVIPVTLLSFRVSEHAARAVARSGLDIVDAGF